MYKHSRKNQRSAVAEPEQKTEKAENTATVTFKRREDCVYEGEEYYSGVDNHLDIYQMCGIENLAYQ